MLKKVMLMAALTIISGLVLADAPKPTVDLPLNEGDFAAIKDYSAAPVQIKVLHPELLKWVDGPNGKAVYFKNDVKRGNRGGVSVKVPATVDVSKGYTIAVTIKPDVMDKRARQHILRYCNGLDRDAGIMLFTYWEGFYVRLGTAPKKTIDVTSNRSVIPARGGKWYKVVTTFDGKVAKLYVDGTKHGEKSAAVAKPKPFHTVVLGSTGDGAGYGFCGIICDFKLYDRALSDAEIAQLQQVEE